MLKMLMVVTFMITGNVVLTSQRNELSRLETPPSSSRNGNGNGNGDDSSFSAVEESREPLKDYIHNDIERHNRKRDRNEPSKMFRKTLSIDMRANRLNNEVTEDSNDGGPYFDKSASKNVTALLGKTAYLNCRVKNLSNRTMFSQVSWVRHRDVHLLTVGRYTYTSDQRFRAIHQPQSEDWTLQIKFSQHHDSGVYECQVSTIPHISHYIHLSVVEPSTEIVGAPDLFIESGSHINLTCIIHHSPEPPAYIYWNHNNKIISYDSPRGGVSVITNKDRLTTTSFLLIKFARGSDSGVYQCNPSNAKARSVTVHVLNGEYPAAMQRAMQSQQLLMTSHQYLFVYLSMSLFTLAYCKRHMQQFSITATSTTMTTTTATPSDGIGLIRKGIGCCIGNVDSGDDDAFDNANAM